MFVPRDVVDASDFAIKGQHDLKIGEAAVKGHAPSAIVDIGHAPGTQAVQVNQSYSREFLIASVISMILNSFFCEVNLISTSRFFSAIRCRRFRRQSRSRLEANLEPDESRRPRNLR